MTLIPFRTKQVDPFRDMLNDDFFYGSFFPAMEKALNKNSASWFPALDVAEGKDTFTIKADLPGLEKEDVRLSFDNGVLTIEGERKNESEEKDKNYHRIERTCGQFVRSLNLGTSVDANAITADYKNGVLNITIPKSEKAKSKVININVK